MINQKRLIALTQKVLRFNSENPPGNEAALADFIEKDMRSLGLPVKTHSFARNRPNVVATLHGSLPRDQAAAGSLLMTPHFDTVPIGTGWKFNPLGGEIHGGKIYGRGASDDKVNLACAMEVMRSLVEDGTSLNKDLIMAATVDEETGSKQGLIPLLTRGILKPKSALILDADEFDTYIAQKGLLHCRVAIFGKKAHGAYNWRGVNAIEIAARLIGRIKQYQFQFTPHKLLHPPTINVGVIKGGDKVNMVADFCEFALDIRFLPGMGHRTILADIRKIIQTETRKFRIEIDDQQNPYEIDPGHPLVRTYLETARSLRLRSRIKASEGATVMTFFKKYKIPAFATGFGSAGTAHTTDEYVRVKNLYRGACLLEQFIKNHDQLQTV